MEENNRRIAKNTIYLYIRTLVIMFLSFFTTRIVLEKLGASDYGINNLVAGFTTMFGVLNNILSTSTNRFLSLSLGKNDTELQKKVFSTALVMHLIVAFTVVCILEIAGLWFLENKLNINSDRVWAAKCVFHIAVFNVFWQCTQTPFSACVTSHEHFNMYAIMSIYDVVAKLLVVYFLVILPGDKLIIYALLNMFVSLTSVWIYRFYCVKHFEECTFSMKIDKPLCKEMLKFSGWGAFGQLIYTINGQGQNIILNIFYTTVMNAAKGLASTVNYTITQFIAGFMTAAQPQLVKFWGAGDRIHFEKLIFNVTQYSIFLLAIIGVPALLEIDYVVNLWIGGNVPEYTTDFIKITLVCGIIYRSNSMIGNGLLAAGFIKQQNLYSAPLYIMSLPVLYFVLHMGWGPLVAMWIGNGISLIEFIINLILLHNYTKFPSWTFFKDIFLKNILIISIAYMIPWIIQQQMEPGFLRFIIVCLIAVVCTVTLLYFLGMNKDTRHMVKEEIYHKFFRK